MHNPKILLAVAALFTLALSSSCEARRGADDAREGGHRSTGLHADRQDGTTSADNPQAIAAGKELFAKNCAGCHGRDATGRGGPNLTRQTLKYGAGDRDLRESIAKGRPGGMPAFADRIDGDGIGKLSAYIRSRAGGK